MASSAKKRIRERFKAAVFARAGGQCEVRTSNGWCRCLWAAVDAHHIESRDTAPCGGYVLDNGIALCGPHHEKAEAQQQSDTGPFRPSELRRWTTLKSPLNDALSRSFPAGK